MSERQYAAHVGLSRGAIQKAKRAGRLVLFPDDSIDAEASDRRRAETTDLSKSRPKAAGRPGGMKPVPAAVIASANETLRENGVTVPEVGEAGAYMKAKTFNEIMKAQERKLGLQIKRGELVDRNRAISLVFRLAREERDAWVNWPARVAALMAAELTVSCSEAVGHEVTIETAAMQKVLEAHVRAHLEELAQPRIAL